MTRFDSVICFDDQYHTHGNFIVTIFNLYRRYFCYQMQIETFTMGVNLENDLRLSASLLPGYTGSESEITIGYLLDEGTQVLLDDVDGPVR